MKNAEGRQIALKKSYYRVYEKQVGKAEKMLVNRKKISKSIQKARESYRITPEQKEYLKSLK